MSPLGWHVMIRLSDDRVLAPDTPTRRLLARLVLRAAEPFTLLAFRAADTHLHMEMVGSRGEAGRLAWLVELAWQARSRPGVPFNRPRIKPIHDQHYLRTCFRYVLDQERHHGIELDPFHDASNLPDLLGLRVLGAWTIPLVAGRLPRVRRGELLRLLGCSDLEGEGGLQRLSTAAAAAAGLPDLSGSDHASAAARRAAVHAAGRRLTRRQLAELLGLPLASIKRYRAEDADPHLVRAVRRQLALREHLASVPGSDSR